MFGIPNSGDGMKPHLAFGRGRVAPRRHFLKKAEVSDCR